MKLTNGMDRGQFHDKAWALWQAKALDDAKLPKLSIHAIRTLWDVLFDSMSTEPAQTSETCECGYSLETSCNVFDPTCKRNAKRSAVVLGDERAAFEAWWLSDVPEEHRVFAKKLLDGYGTGYTAAAGVADAWEAWQAAIAARAASPAAPAQSPKGDERAAAQWETTSIANELWQLADQCGYEQFRDALTVHVKKAYQDGWDDHKSGVTSVTYGDSK